MVHHARHWCNAVVEQPVYSALNRSCKHPIVGANSTVLFFPEANHHYLLNDNGEDTIWKKKIIPFVFLGIVTSPRSKQLWSLPMSTKYSSIYLKGMLVFTVSSPICLISTRLVHTQSSIHVKSQKIIVMNKGHVRSKLTPRKGR